MGDVVSFNKADCQSVAWGDGNDEFHATLDLIQSMIWKDLRCAGRTLEYGADINYQMDVEHFREEVMTKTDDSTRRMTTQLWEGLTDDFVSPLMLAVETGFADGVRWIAENNGDPNIHSGPPDYRTALHAAISSKTGSRAQRDNLFDALFDYPGLRLELPDEAHDASIQGNEILLASSPLISAISAHEDEIAVRLLDRGADANRADPNGETPLGAAAYENRPAVVRSLLRHGARPGDADRARANRTPRQIAVQFGFVNVLDQIDQHVSESILTKHANSITPKKRFQRRPGGGL